MLSAEINKNLKSKYSPEGSELRNLQMRMVEMLDYFDSFCTKHNIKYWLAYGTCLGAIRHEGFIPWDDDMDIEMLREDYEKFISLRKYFENDNYILQDNVSDYEYITPYSKIRDKNSIVKEIHNRDLYLKYKGVFIDVFVRDTSSFTATRISHIAQYISYFLTNVKSHSIRKLLKRIVYTSLHSILFPFLRIFIKIFSKGNLLYPDLGYGFYEPINSKSLFPLKKVKFENREYPVPGNYDDYLRQIYGEYMKIPNKEEDFRIHFTTIDLNHKE